MTHFCANEKRVTDRSNFEPPPSSQNPIDQLVSLPNVAYDFSKNANVAAPKYPETDCLENISRHVLGRRRRMVRLPTVADGGGL